MQELPNELHALIFADLDQPSKASMRLTCTAFQKLLPRTRSTNRFLTEACCKHGYYNLFLLTVEWKQPLLVAYYKLAVRSHSLDILRYLDLHEVKLPCNLLVTIALHGTEEMFNYFENYPELQSEREFAYTVPRQWLTGRYQLKSEEDNKFVHDGTVFANAIIHNNLSLAKRMHSSGYPLKHYYIYKNRDRAFKRIEVLDRSLNSKHVEMVRWLMQTQGEVLTSGEVAHIDDPELLTNTNFNSFDCIMARATKILAHKYGIEIGSNSSVLQIFEQLSPELFVPSFVRVSDLIYLVENNEWEILQFLERFGIIPTGRLWSFSCKKSIITTEGCSQTQCE
jgi:hypothetical protein